MATESGPFEDVSPIKNEGFQVKSILVHQRVTSIITLSTSNTCMILSVVNHQQQKTALES